MKNNKLTRYNSVEELFDMTNTDNPSEKDVAELRKIFETDPQLYYKKINMAQVTVDNLIETVNGTPLAKESFKMNVKNLRLEFRYENSLPMEKLLIDHIIMCWVRMNAVEHSYTNNLMGKESFNLNIAQYWERLLSSSQNRFLRAIGNRCEGFVFINPDTGTRYNSISKSFFRTVRKLRLKVGDTYLRFHDLRHVFCTWLSNEGVSRDVLQMLLGHRDRSTTDRYITLNPLTAGKLLEKLPEIRSNNTENMARIGKVGS